MHYILFLKKKYAGYQTIWIEDQAPRFVGPDLDLYCLKRSFMISIFVEIDRKYFHFVQELLEVTVFVSHIENVTFFFFQLMPGNLSACQLSSTKSFFN